MTSKTSIPNDFTFVRESKYSRHIVFGYPNGEGRNTARLIRATWDPVTRRVSEVRTEDEGADLTRAGDNSPLLLEQLDILQAMGVVVGPPRPSLPPIPPPSALPYGVRILRADEDPTVGIYPRDPFSLISLCYHVSGTRLRSPWISFFTYTDAHTAARLFNGYSNNDPAKTSHFTVVIVDFRRCVGVLGDPRTDASCVKQPVSRANANRWQEISLRGFVPPHAVIHTCTIGRGAATPAMLTVRGAPPRPPTVVHPLVPVVLPMMPSDTERPTTTTPIPLETVVPVVPLNDHHHHPPDLHVTPDEQTKPSSRLQALPVAVLLTGGLDPSVATTRKMSDVHPVQDPTTTTTTTTSVPYIRAISASSSHADTAARSTACPYPGCKKTYSSAENMRRHFNISHFSLHSSRIDKFKEHFLHMRLSTASPTG